MNLPERSVARPITTLMLTMIVVILGGVALSRLRIDLLPTVEMPSLTVRTVYEGAGPEVMERLVTQILEEILATVPGVERMTSLSAEGTSTIRINFVWGTDIDVAAQDVQSKIDDEINELPDNIVRPRVSKFDIASFPVVILGISSDLDPVEMTELIDDHVRYRFARVPGVAQADLWGGFSREVRVGIMPERLISLGLPLDQVLRAIRDANLDLPAGSIDEGRFELTLRAPADYADMDEIRNTVVTTRNGRTITLAEVAEVQDTYERRTRLVRVNGSKGLRMGIRKQADANTVEVSRAIMAEIEAVNRDFPQVKVVPVINQGNFIERSIKNVANSVLYGGSLAILVLLFFLRNLRSTLVIAVSIPISIVATFAVIYFGGFTLNLMTLGGLALGVGMMVDSSIVVLENIYRRREENQESPAEAAVRGAAEVAPAIIASTITTLVIFLPLVFVRGVSGILFKELAYVIVFSLVCSLLVSLSVVPLLAAKLLKPAPSDGGAAEGNQAGVRRLTLGYRDLLRWSLGRPWLIVAAACVAMAGALLLLPMIGTEFLPPSDEGEVRVTGEMEVGTRLGLVDAQTQLMEQFVYPAVPESIATVASVGANGFRPDSASRGEIRLSLKPATERTRSNTEIAGELRKLLDQQIPGMTLRIRAPQGQFLLERILGGDEGLTIEVRGFEIPTLEHLVDQVVAAIQDVRGITDIETTYSKGTPQAFLRINRAKIADVGLSVRQVAQLVETAVAGSQAGDFRTQGNAYRIFVQLKDAEKRSLEEVLDLTITAPSGAVIALRNLVDIERGLGPILIDRKDQQRLLTVKANLAGRDLGSVAREVEARLDEIPKPLGYELGLAGNYEEQQKAFRELVISLILALVLVYMVLACQYESLVDPLIVMFSVPLAAIGVLVALFLTSTTLNVQSYIGCIMLGGIVVNNAILLVDQAGRLRLDQAMATKDALAEAGRRRLRPILMTTATTILGLMPLALGIGEGADAQAPLARAVVGGLIGSTLITLVLIPALYRLFHHADALQAKERVTAAS
ncbi:efflux RND transporter permease subunit [Acanthopleuribacter pedis]|uniref:Efflux RND transporter permease subunit n=1 Tax=Acanthopleuribacter pedis TaxID=442870 RepID=A0A8J7Q3I1_9BACT|nr:efflux RND transporter permease subunit [Acanthopleuribacter pedis]MBO1317412.1 efflux RND transporter permease subunit [Acanthopleuribacter pedis]